MAAKSTQSLPASNIQHLLVECIVITVERQLQLAAAATSTTTWLICCESARANSNPWLLQAHLLLVPLNSSALIIFLQEPELLPAPVLSTIWRCEHDATSKQAPNGTGCRQMKIKCSSSRAQTAPAVAGSPVLGFVCASVAACIRAS